MKMITQIKIKSTIMYAQRTQANGYEFKLLITNSDIQNHLDIKS